MNKTITIDGQDFTILEGTKYLFISQEKITHVGQVVKYKKYDVTGATPELVGEEERVIDQDDLEIIEYGRGRYV